MLVLGPTSLLMKLRAARLSQRHQLRRPRHATHLDAGDTVQWAHSVGEIVTALAGAGLTMNTVHEHLSSDRNDRPDVLTRGHDDRWRLALWNHPLPALLAITASKPST